MLKDDRLLSTSEIHDLNYIKGKGLAKLEERSTEKYQNKQKDDKLMLSTVANIKIEQILEKRVQLKNKLKMIEDLNKVYQLEQNSMS